MKTTLKTLMIAAIALFAATTSASAQKIGYINLQEVIQIMPELKTATTTFEAYSKEIGEQFQALNTEFATKSQDFGAKSSSYSDLIRQQKEKELEDLASRIETFRVDAQTDLQKKQEELMQPIYIKVQTALKKVAKEQAMLFVLDTASPAIPYYNEAATTNMLPFLKKELGLQ